MDRRLRRKGKATPPQDRRQKWRKNYMMMSLPCQADDVIKLTSLKRTEFHSFTQSLNRKTSKQIKQERRKKRLLKLLNDCAESLEGIASKSYVESMRSCTTTIESSSSAYTSNYGSSHDLIVLDDKMDPPLDNNAVSGLASGMPRSDSKNLSEIVLRDNSDHFYSNIGCGVSFFNSTDNLPRYVTPKLRLASSFCSSYVEDSDSSYSHPEDGVNRLATSKGWLTPAPVVNRTNRYARLNEDDYRDLVSNGKSTAFLSQNEDDLSLYYDDEFDTERSPIGLPLHDSDLEAAICNEYASLLHKANATNFNAQSMNSTNAHSNFSSDFDNIFPASLSLHDNLEEVCSANHEEIADLDSSVPNYSDIPASTKEDYQLTFAQAESLYSDARSSYSQFSLYEDRLDDGHVNVKLVTERNQVPKPPRSHSHRQPHNDVAHVSTKKVSFSDELAIVNENDRTHSDKMEEIGNSTTWQQMKQNYTTWGQIKSDRVVDCKKSKSVPDIRLKEKPATVVNDEPNVDRKRYSLTLWEQYKRSHSLLGLGESSGELTTPDAFTEPTVAELNKLKAEEMNEYNRAKQDLARSINELLDDALGGPPPSQAKSPATTFNLPDLSFLRKNKLNLTEYKWWKEIFDQPSFCTPGESRTSSLRTCSQCERRHSVDHQVIVFQGSKPAQYKICELSMLEQLFVSPTSQCQCTREKLCDLSSGIATGSSGATPREPNSWQHIADFLKRRQKHTDTNSRGSLNSTLSDQQLLDVVACVEAADTLAKQQQQTSSAQETDVSQDTLLQIWKLVSSLECVLSMGLKSHKLVTVAMGKIRARVSIWDIVEESAASAGKLTNIFAQIISEISRYQLNDASLKFCLFIVGLMNCQCLDFWLSILWHNGQLMDKYYTDDSYLRSKVMADRKLHTEMIQALQHLSLFTWDIDYNNMIIACTQPVADKDHDEALTRAVPQRQSSLSSMNQQKPASTFSKAVRYYSANNVRQAVLI